MMSYIWAILIAFSVITAAFSGDIETLSNAILESGFDAVTLCLKLLGMLCLWNGLMNIAKESGLCDKIGRLLSPFLKIIFRETKDDKEALNAISMNITANLLGLGNAATPLGLEAMKRLKMHNKSNNEASNDMIKFVVLNTAAIKIIPTTVAVIRQSFGSQNPMDIITAVWISSLAALSAALVSAEIFQFFSKKKLKK